MATHRSAAAAALRPARYRRLAALAVVIAPLLAACGAGFQAQTNQIYQPGLGITDRDGGVYAINTLIVTDGDGNGTLVGALINQVSRPDVVESVAVRNREGKQLTTTLIARPLTLPSQRAVQLATGGDVRITGGLDPGSYASLSIAFANAAPVDIEIPIVSATGDFADVPVGPLPSGTRR